MYELLPSSPDIDTAGDWECLSDDQLGMLGNLPPLDYRFRSTSIF